MRKTYVNSRTPKPVAMTRNHFQFSLRRLRRRKIHTAIHNVGLTLGKTPGTSNMSAKMTKVESVRKKAFSTQVFEFNFLDEQPDTLYK